jgi:hypothetical protein
MWRPSVGTSTELRVERVMNGWIITPIGLEPDNKSAVVATTPDQVAKVVATWARLYPLEQPVEINE